MVKLFVPILLIALGFLCDWYLYHRYFAKFTSCWKFTWWIPLAIVCCFFIKFLCFNEGLVAEYNTTNMFLLCMCLFIVPKMMFTLFAWIPKAGPYIGGAIALGIIYIIINGITVGFCDFRVRNIVYESKDVPEAFDGYRIAQFSDSHTGVFRGPYEHLLKESIDSINAQHPDLICFVGDIQNFTPAETEKFKKEFSSLHAPDGVFTVMGNHDYVSYIDVSEQERARLVQKTRDVQRSFGWDMLQNENRIIHRGNDSIVIVGEDNWGQPPFPQKGDVKKALKGLNVSGDGKVDSTMSIMLSHDPDAWTRHVLPAFKPNLTLAGHTHGTQISLFGWSPASMKYEQWGGEYYKDGLMISVSTGFGGNFPFRFNMPREVVIITLKHKK